jgi:hypothetical protein
MRIFPRAGHGVTPHLKIISKCEWWGHPLPKLISRCGLLRCRVFSLIARSWKKLVALTNVSIS